jgi:hypothetical protein
VARNTIGAISTGWIYKDGRKGKNRGTGLVENEEGEYYVEQIMETVRRLPIPERRLVLRYATVLLTPDDVSLKDVIEVVLRGIELGGG